MERKTELVSLSIGCKPNSKDPCVWTINRKGTRLTICTHVDDVLTTSKLSENTQWIGKQLKKEFGEIKEQAGSDMKYLGMRLQRDKAGNIILSMDKLLAEILEGVNSTQTDPANDNLMKSPVDPTLLPEKEKTRFHTLVAKLLYLVLRIRPDILVGVSFLTTRVTSPTVSDRQKLEHLLRYLYGTRDLQYIINNSPIERVYGYIDSSHACHSDVIGHYGLVIVVGTTAVHFVSKKMRKVASDSTAAELIALSDRYNNVITAHEFLINLGFHLPPPVILQDNKSTIQMVAPNSKNLQDKYMAVRQSMVRERIILNELEVRFTSTDTMLADALTKPLHGKSFSQFRRRR